MQTDLIHNQKLYQQKQHLLNKITADECRYNFSLILHGIEIEFRTNQLALIDYLKLHFIKKKTSSPLIITHYSPLECDISDDFFEDEFESICFTQLKHNDEIAIQRDFIAKSFKEEIVTVFSPSNPDGLHNFLRWLISRRLLVHNKAILHSSVIVGHDKKAYVFLGVSGAGKTTTCINAAGRRVVGDDMNLIEIDQDQIFARAAFVGGKLGPQIQDDERFPVAGFYWLEKSNQNELIPCSKAAASRKLLASIANIFWTHQDQNLNQLGLNFALKLATNVDLSILRLKNDSSYWQLLELNIFTIKVSGSSMFPLIKDNDELTITRKKILRDGRIYLYRSSSGELIAHRLIQTPPLLMKGDFEINHEVIRPEQIIGEVIAINESKITGHLIYNFLSKTNHRMHAGMVRRTARWLMQKYYRLSQFQL